MLAVGRNLHAVSTRSTQQFHLPGTHCCYEMLAHPNSHTEMTGHAPWKRPGVSRHKNRGRALLMIQARLLD